MLTTGIALSPADGTGTAPCLRVCARCGNSPHLFNWLLCTIDPRNDPIANYDACVTFGPPKVDFLLPHGTWALSWPGKCPTPARRRTRTG